MTVKRELEFSIERENQIAIAQHWVGRVASRGLPGGPVVVRLGRERRTLDQNAHIHPVVRVIKNHMEAHGAPKRNEYWWRYYLLGKFAGQEITPDPDGSGQFIVINNAVGTSDLRKDKAAEFIDWAYAFGADVGVDWEAERAKWAAKMAEVMANE
jgi:hypothetical protein